MSHPKQNQALRLVDMTAEDLRELVADTVATALAEQEPRNDAEPLQLNRSEASQFLGISLPQLDRLVREQGLPYSVVGDCKRFDPRELKQWAKARAAAKAVQP
jgi:predicted DNA-binding transcriptional regulator AlpA